MTRTKAMWGWRPALADSFHNGVINNRASPAMSARVVINWAVTARKQRPVYQYAYDMYWRLCTEYLQSWRQWTVYGKYQATDWEAFNSHQSIRLRENQSATSRYVYVSYFVTCIRIDLVMTMSLQSWMFLNAGYGREKGYGLSTPSYVVIYMISVAQW